MKLLLVSLSLVAAVVTRGGEFTIDVAKPAGEVSPTLYGLMTDEISFSYDGGLYAVLIRNRAFLDYAELSSEQVRSHEMPLATT